MVYEAPNDDIEIQAPPPGAAYSFTAGAEVLAGQVVTLTGDNSVSPSTTDGEEVIGVATQSVSAGDTVMVLGNGARARVTAGAAVTAGDEIASGGGTNDDGTVKSAVDGTIDFTNSTASKGDFVLGNAHEGAAAGDTLVMTVDLSGYRPGS